MNLSTRLARIESCRATARPRRAFVPSPTFEAAWGRLSDADRATLSGPKSAPSWAEALWRLEGSYASVLEEPDDTGETGDKRPTPKQAPRCAPLAPVPGVYLVTVTR